MGLGFRGSKKQYITAFNIFWLRYFENSSPSVPVSRQRVEELATFYFGQGHDFFGTLLEVAMSNPRSLSSTLLPFLF